MAALTVVTVRASLPPPVQKQSVRATRVVALHVLDGTIYFVRVEIWSDERVRFFRYGTQP